MKKITFIGILVFSITLATFLFYFFAWQTSNYFELGFVKRRNIHSFEPDKLIVISRYNEDISWVATHLPHIKHIVYDRTDPNPMYSVQENRGHEASSYLKYIIDHYDNLPEYIAFVHGHRKSWHYTDIVPVLQNLYWGKYDYCSLNPKFYGEMKNSTNDYKLIAKYWKKLYEESLGPMPESYEYWCCASFHVTKERILVHSKLFYQNLYNWLQSGELESFWSSRVMEWTWGLIFAPSLKPGPLDMCDISNCTKF